MVDASEAGVHTVAKVVLESALPQLDRLFDYAIPDGLRTAAVAGVRVTVPIRSAGRIANGFIVDVAEPGDYSGALSELDSVVSAVPVLTPEIWTLARRASERAAGNASDILRLAIPSRQVRVEKAYLPDESRDAAIHSAQQITGYANGVIEEAIRSRARLAVDAIPGVTQLSSGTWVGNWAITLAESAAQCVSAGATAILVVPDYRDQEQLGAVLAALLPAELIVPLDARQTNAERYRNFLRTLDESPLVILGNRSAIYAPARTLGLIAMWDDGDPLLSEPLSPYVHARDAALLRQEQQSCGLLFAGHSRSTEVERLVELGFLESVSPKPSVLPKVILTAHQNSGERLAMQARIPSAAWREATTALKSGPVLVQVARPGYAPRLACADCRQSARCVTCQGPLSQRSARSTPACAWCGALAVGWSCVNCGGSALRLVGSGATRTAEDLGRAFPGVRIVIADGGHPILRVDAAPALVIATRGAEPIASGGYRAVLLLDGESLLMRESLRVGEDCLRSWSNAAALAATRAPVVLVGVAGAIADALATWRQADYARHELLDRKALRFPPAVRVATVTGAATSVADAVAILPTRPGDTLGPVELADGSVRSIVRFDYASGAEVAAGLRAAIVRNATGRRRPPGAPTPSTPRSVLKVRFDDTEPFVDA
jgi:primosomal protein N' (replication factor Y) (superfamily II helicase)